MRKIAFGCVSAVVIAAAIIGCFIKPQKESVTLTLEKKRVFIAVPPFELRGGCPAGGTYQGQGVTDNLFSPEEAGVGVHEIVYTYKGASVVDSIEVFGARSRQPDKSCTVCGGSGFIVCRPRVPCSDCDKGHVVIGKCESCGGAGRVKTAWKLWLGTKHCSDCQGSGLRYAPCKRCKGTGVVKCPACKGTGKAVCRCVK